MTPERNPVAAALRRGAAAEDTDVARATDGFLRRADSAGLIDVAYTTVDTPFGTMLLAATDRGLVRLGLPMETFDGVLDELADRISPRVVELPRRLDAARREIDEYFSGARREFDLPLDRRLITGAFAVRVLDELSQVPFGQAITYSEAALRAGSPRAHRAAGNALGSNPIPLVIPCHRVVRSGGAIGGYGGGPELKRRLLLHEGWLS